MSAKKTQNNITSLKTNSNESKYLNNEVDDKVQKIQQSSKQQGDDDEDLSDLANGGWEDDFTDNEDDDVESRKEWETLEFLCQISKTENKNDPYKDNNDDVKNRIDLKNDSSIIGGNLEQDDDDYDDDCDDDFNGSTVKRNETEKNIKDSKYKKDNKMTTSSLIPTCLDVINPLTDNNEKSSSIPLENRKRSSGNDNEIGVDTLFQKTKKQKDDNLKIKKVHK
jgi:hypothetical protein